MNFLLFYYLMIAIFVGIGGTIALIDPVVYSRNVFRTIFMYQYAVYELTKDKFNTVGIIILELLTTLSVWFLNIFIAGLLCLWFILSLVCKGFYFIFRKR